MGIKKMMAKAYGKAGDGVAKLSQLSPAQLSEVQEKRAQYLLEIPDPNSTESEEQTLRLMATCGVEVFQSFLPQLSELYVPVDKDAEYDGPFMAINNIRFFQIKKWVNDKSENCLEKLINVYNVLSTEACNIALIFHRGVTETEVYLAVVNTANADNCVDVENFVERVRGALKGNFPGTEIAKENEKSVLPFISEMKKYSVATATNVPAEKSEKFSVQTVEKLLDGVVPANASEEYTVILLATPIDDLQERKFHLGEIYSGLEPFASWQTQFSYNQSDSTNASATFGVNVGASAGIQNGQNRSVANTSGTTDSSSVGATDSQSHTDSMGASSTKGTTVSDAETTGTSETKGNNTSHTDSKGSNESRGTSVGGSVGVSSTVGVNVPVGPSVSGSINQSLNYGKDYNYGWNQGTSDTTGTSKALTETKNLTKSLAKNIAKSTTKTTAEQVGKAITSTLGKAVTNSVTTASGISQAVNLGANVGANFARASNVTATVGKGEAITQFFSNFNVKTILKILEAQMKRLECSTALGMWDFAAYFVSEDLNVVNNVAHSYVALTQGEDSYTSQAAVNVWRGDLGVNSGDAKEICSYLRELRHPIFGLNPNVIDFDPTFLVYPDVVTPTTGLTGKELSYALNFPKKSVSGLPVIECAEFGRNVTTYDDITQENASIHLGSIFHMQNKEKARVDLSIQSLSSHMFITGSTGSGKSNAVYQILNEARKNGVKFLVIEPAKGEYKDVFGNEEDVSVFGTNPFVTQLLKINPFSFPADIHILEHLDRLVEIFNVCWPMYAAMPAVLKNAIEKAYEDCGWNMVSSVNPYGCKLYPTFADVARNVKVIIESSEYDAENKGAYKGSLLTRLQSLSNGINGLIFSTDEISYSELFDNNVIVDISRVGSSETKSLLMGMLVLKLQEYRISTKGAGNFKLKHITVLEEAHNILKRSAVGGSTESASLEGKSVEMISNAIAEMRTYGEGFVIADQAPALLDMAAIRNTNTKVILRLPDQADRELVGRAANLNDDQIKELAKLPCGVAAVYQNEWIQPVLCKVEKYEMGDCVYAYHPIPSEENSVDVDIALEIAELLSRGIKLGREALIMMKEKMDTLALPASVQVTAFKLFEKPPKEPRMTKIAPVMSALFTTVYDAVKKTFAETHNPIEWTEAAELELQETVNRQIQAQIRRDIIQGIITQVVYNEMNDIKALELWAKEGGLK